jgi:hypothetical protein
MGGPGAALWTQGETEASCQPHEGAVLYMVCQPVGPSADDVQVPSEAPDPDPLVKLLQIPDPQNAQN